jgi:hypothetical protein
MPPTTPIVRTSTRPDVFIIEQMSIYDHLCTVLLIAKMFRPYVRARCVAFWLIRARLAAVIIPHILL